MQHYQIDQIKNKSFEKYIGEEIEIIDSRVRLGYSMQTSKSYITIEMKLKFDPELPRNQC